MNIIIIDDDFLITTALKTILEADGEIQVVSTGTDGSEALPLYRRYKPDVVLMDIRMKHMSGLDAANDILNADTQAKILLLTTFLDDEYIVRALKIGAKGYLLKQDYDSIAPAIKAVYKGQTVFGNEITAKIPDLLTTPEQFDYSQFDISDREYDVIELVADGLSNKEIAEHLYLSEGTVRNYLSSILDKLNLRDRTQLAIFYYQH
ncbi:MAG: response regulator transcription factor [Lachnospiraceae bacterium]